VDRGVAPPGADDKPRPTIWFHHHRGEVGDRLRSKEEGVSQAALERDEGDGVLRGAESVGTIDRVGERERVSASCTGCTSARESDWGGDGDGICPVVEGTSAWILSDVLLGTAVVLEAARVAEAPTLAN
jgi:hypothetical protein